MKLPTSLRRAFVFLLLVALTAGLCGIATPGLAQRSDRQVAVNLSEVNPPLATQPASLLDQGKALYDAEQFSRAVPILQQAVQEAQARGNRLQQAIALSNLSLTYQQLGAWAEAEQALQQSLGLLEPQQATVTTQQLSVLAQTLNVQARLQLGQGQAQAALETWERTAMLYQQLENTTGVVQSRINQSQALRSLGFYNRAIATLTDIQRLLESSADSLDKAVALRSLGDALRVSGTLDKSYEQLEQSLQIAQAIGEAKAIAAAQISLANTRQAQASEINLDVADRTDQERVRQWRGEALQRYQSVVETRPSLPLLMVVQAQLNQLNLLISMERIAEAVRLIPAIQTQLNQLPSSRAAIDAQVNFAHSLIDLKPGATVTPAELPSVLDIANGLSTAYQQAIQLNDQRAISYVLGTLGYLYEQSEQFSDAKPLTQQAMILSQSIQADDLSYRWQWQLGRMVKLENQQSEAIALYSEAYNSLQRVRNDLIAANPDLQFSFRNDVEPIYRDLVDLLLQKAPQVFKPKEKQAILGQARSIIDSLRVAELQNFFRAACLDATSQIDAIINEQTPTAAVIYPILLRDRLEIILKLAGTDLMQYTLPASSEAEITQVLKTFRRELQEPYTFRSTKEIGQQVYNWLVQPMRDELDRRGIKTLIFVLDGALRNIPMSALYDGNHYLIENFAVSLELGLTIRNPLPLRRNAMRILAAGLVNPPPTASTYAQLPNVTTELDFISSLGLPATILRDTEFTKPLFKQSLQQANPQVIHLATHGQFGVNPEDTFILYADGKVPLNQLADLFKTEQRGRSRAVELLVLSACRTATGDSRTVLGIAGTAVEAGARSAIASLWSLNDAATVPVIEELYRHLGQEGVTRAEALRQAQLKLLQEPEGLYTHPRYWSPYVLVGSWL
ncbi:MAG: CHAT domain-containing protein [Oculatellaceae cyanobacterium bins.114]|nr:CHAT domain-containing protein [Oculatellaceae cyanobacterium bins.114]